MRNTAYSIGLARTVKTAVVRSGIQQVFIRRLQKADMNVQKIVIASPWISYGQGENTAFDRIVNVIKRRHIPTYVFTRSPNNPIENNALEILATCPSVELVHNNNLHAKIYACMAPYPYGFAILGSANLTHKSEELYEIGLIVLAGGGGDEIIKQIAAFGLEYLRTRADSLVIKRMESRRY